MSPALAAKYERDARRYWDLFYKRNGDNFFKDRHYLSVEFPELNTLIGRIAGTPVARAAHQGGEGARPQAQAVVLELGCGVGNAFIPMLEEIARCAIAAMPSADDANTMGAGHWFPWTPPLRSPQCSPLLHCIACDFSRRAVHITRRKVQKLLTSACPPGDAGHIDIEEGTVVCDRPAHVGEDTVFARIALGQNDPGGVPIGCDVVECDLSESADALCSVRVPERGVDVATMIFVLSAMSPESMGIAVEAVKRAMKRRRPRPDDGHGPSAECGRGCSGPGALEGTSEEDPGGLVFVRDYARGDLAELRLDRKKKGQPARKIADNFYVRGDGTRAYYFSPESLEELFNSRGFATVYVRTRERTVSNKKADLNMDRRWIQAVFRLDCAD